MGAGSASVTEASCEASPPGRPFPDPHPVSEPPATAQLKSGSSPAEAAEAPGAPSVDLIPVRGHIIRGGGPNYPASGWRRRQLAVTEKSLKTKVAGTLFVDTSSTP